MSLLWWKKYPLKMAWRVEKNGALSFLVGTAHFFPYSFEKSIVGLVRKVETVLLEGPLDHASMERVIQHGCKVDCAHNLSEDLGPATREEINRHLHHRLPRHVTSIPYLRPSAGKARDMVATYATGVQPWLAFFRIWSAFLNWSYATDLEAYSAALKMGKKVVFLETVEEQVAALEGVPYERILNYLKMFSVWEEDDKQFVRCYLAGRVEDLRYIGVHLPTRCESIIKNRDPILFQRMEPFLKAGNCAAFVGVGHIYGIRKLLLKQGYTVTQEVL